MIIYAIYEKPVDFPNSFVVRRWRLRTGSQDRAVPLAPMPARVDPLLEPEWGGHYPIATRQVPQPTIEVEKACMTAPTLEEARKLIPAPTTRMLKEPDDDPKLIEIWV